MGVDKKDPLSPSSQPSPLKGEGGSGLLTLSQKESSPKGEGFPPSPKGTLTLIFHEMDQNGNSHGLEHFEMDWDKLKNIKEVTNGKKNEG